MTIVNNVVATINYTLKNGNDLTIDSSVDKDPLVYIHGMGHLIPGLEKSLEGKVKGDKVNAVISPDDAYGPRRDDMVQVVPKTEFKDIETMEIGTQFQVETENGDIIVTLIELRDEEVVLDGNHPLAGETLHFDVEIIDIREATEEELKSGHIHGKGCNH